jgi:DNA-directed RNA polymerase subunit F
MSDAETKHVMELQLQLAQKLTELGFVQQPSARELVHELAEIAARSRTFTQESLPLFASLSAEHREAFAQLLLQIRADLHAIQDSICDVQPAIQELIDHLTREPE